MRYYYAIRSGEGCKKPPRRGKKEQKMRIKAVKNAAAVKVTAKKAEKPASQKKGAKPAAKAVVFTVHAEKGKSVYLAGEFNGWDPSAKKMAWKARSGFYAATVKLVPGRYEYKFVIDGTWCADPENLDSVQNDQGTWNSVITVK